MCTMGVARILIVDDELSLRRLMRLYLTKAGFTVAEASTGPEALAALRRGDVDLAIVDVMLPEVDGFEVVRQARRNSSIPIILLTARGEEASRVAGLELTRREFDLLGALLANPGRAYTRDQLLDEVWGSRYVSEKTVDVHIVALRRKLGDAVRISTLRGVGYRLETQ